MRIYDGVWICHRGCGSGEFPKLVELVQGCGQAEAHQWVNSNGNSVNIELISKRLAESLGQVPGEAPKPRDLFWWDLYSNLTNKAMPLWFLQRGFSWETIFHWGMKYDPVDDAVVIPVKWNNEVVGTITRNNRLQPKYRNSPNLPKSSIIFGEISTAVNEIMLCEGALDTPWLWQNGYNAGGLLSADISEEQLRILQRLRFGEIILALDNDEAGREGTRKVYSKLLTAGWMPPQIKIIRFPVGIKDPQDCSTELLAELYRTREDYVRWLVI